MRRSVWILPALLLLGLWLWSNPRTPSPQATHPDATVVAHTGTSPRTNSEAVNPEATPASATRDARADGRSRYPAFLPAEADEILQRIARGGPFEYRQDGGVFQNREHRLPPQPRGYYREYTVETPSWGDRGARRIITGGEPPSEYWYTDDHYRSFRRFEVQQ
ncbi:MAG TPA: ribonuclease domain-containing protein [Lysobacter sp.]|jgi:guanyl-specific ribonuclease Sa|nr:ribonuclease domain-containing protein [Lysobacter sp.]